MSKLLEILLLNIFLLLGVNIQCQIIGYNLVNNYSFEEHDTCPNNSGQLFLAKYWKGLSTENYNYCSPSINNVGIPNNFMGFQFSNTGNAFAGFYLHYHDVIIPWDYDYSEVIKNSLKETLKANKQYCINYYINMAEKNYTVAHDYNFQIKYDSITALFSNNKIQDTILSMSMLCDTCIKLTKSVVGIDTSNWFKINGIIKARGGEKYLSIGKYSKINWQPTENMSMFYIFIDDVSVCECSFDINLGPDTTLCEGESIILNPNLPNATYTWQDSSHAATYEAKQPGTYWVRAYVADYDITTTDTIIIKAGDDSYCNPPLTIPNVITPNGDSQNDNFKILNSEYYDIALQIYNRWGRLIYETSNYQNDSSCRDCADGVYFYVLKAKSKRNGREREYKGSLTVING